MSARPREVLEQTSKFSLRDVVTGPEIRTPLQTQASTGMFRFKASAETAPKGRSEVSMKLNLGANFGKTTPVATTPPKPEQRPNLSFSFGAGPRAAPKGPMHTSQLFQSTQARSAPTATLPAPTQIPVHRVADETEKQDVMRLTAYVDELNAQLKEASIRLEHAEANLVHTQKQLSVERAAAQTKATAFKRELATAHEAENKLRDELKARPQRSALSQSAFSQAVGTVLADEERAQVFSREVQELETKISALGDAKVMIESEVEAIRKLREQAQLDLDAMRSKQTEAKQNEQESMRAVNASHEVLAVLEAKKERANAETDAAIKRKSDLQMEHQEALAKIVDANELLSDIQRKIVDSEATAAKSATEALEASRSVEGVVEKSGVLNSQIRSDTAKIDALKAEISRLADEHTKASAVTLAAQTTAEAAKATRDETVIKLAEETRMAKEKIELIKKIAAISDVPDFLLEDDEPEQPEQPASTATAVAPTDAVEPCDHSCCTGEDAARTSVDNVQIFKGSALKKCSIEGDIKTALPGAGGTFAMRFHAMRRPLRGSLATVHSDYTQRFIEHIVPPCEHTGVCASEEPSDGASRMINAVVSDLKAMLSDSVQYKLPVNNLVTAI